MNGKPVQGSSIQSADTENAPTTTKNEAQTVDLALPPPTDNQPLDLYNTSLLKQMIKNEESVGEGSSNKKASKKKATKKKGSEDPSECHISQKQFDDFLKFKALLSGPLQENVPPTSVRWDKALKEVSTPFTPKEVRERIKKLASVGKLPPDDIWKCSKNSDYEFWRFGDRWWLVK